MNGQFAFAEVIGLFAGFDEAGAGGGRELEAVLNDGEGGGRRAEGGMIGRVVEAHDFTVQQESLVALFGNQREGFLERELLRKREVEGDEDFLVVRALRDEPDFC